VHHFLHRAQVAFIERVGSFRGTLFFLRFVDRGPELRVHIILLFDGGLKLVEDSVAESTQDISLPLDPSLLLHGFGLFLLLLLLGLLALLDQLEHLRPFSFDIKLLVLDELRSEAGLGAEAHSCGLSSSNHSRDLVLIVSRAL